MKNEPAKPAYASGAAVKPGDLVTGTIDVGSFPAEPFLGKVVFAAHGRAQVVFLKRTASLDKAAPLFRRQSRVAKTYSDAMVPVCTLKLRQRCSNHTVKIAGAPSLPGQRPWGAERSFGHRPRAG